MDTIYLTTQQIEALFQLTNDGNTLVGVQVEGDANARSTVRLVATRGGGGRAIDNDFTIIEPDGATPGWER